MPGNWLIVLMAGLCLGLAPETGMVHIGWASFTAILIIAVLGELFEFAASALGANRLGGSKRGALLAIVGSITGAIVGFFFGSIIPIPIVGSVLASLLLGGGGAFVGTLAGERWAGKDWDASLKIGSAAFWGRLLGTVGKAVCGSVACALFLLALWF